MNTTLNRLSNASAGNKEDNIFRVFAYLNSKGEFSPMMITTRVNVKPTTILNYLKAIQKAQFFEENYRKRVEKPFFDQFFSTTRGKERDIAEKVHSSWQKELAKVDDKWKEKNSQLLQFVYSDNYYVSENEFYNRLEQSLLVYEFLKKNK